jgi:hypothetical protein
MRNTDGMRFLRTVAQGLLEEFRDVVCDQYLNSLISPPQSPQMFTKSYIQHNPSKFLNTDWVEVSDLKAFLARQESECDASKKQRLYQLGNGLAARVKREPDPVLRAH